VATLKKKKRECDRNTILLPPWSARVRLGYDKTYAVTKDSVINLGETIAIEIASL
jgi:hypothetical protein